MKSAIRFHALPHFRSNATKLSPEAEPLYRERLREQKAEANRIFFWLLPLQWLFAIALALFVSPRAWNGLTSSIHPHLWAAIVGGAMLVSTPLLCIRYRPDALTTPQFVAVAQMLFSALFIHLTGGRIETHFHVFGSLAVLAFYLDRSVLLTATAVVVADHLVRGLFLPQSVYGVSAATWWRSLEHGGWVVFEVFFLYRFAQRSVTRTFCVAAEAAAAQQALKDSEGRLSLIIETAYDAYVAMDSHGRIVGWNEQARRTFGWTREEVLGQSLSQRIIPERFHEAHESGITRFLKTGEGPVLSQRLELSAIHRDGREFPIEITISSVRWGDSFIFHAFLRDITERHEAARKDEEMNRRLVDASRQAGKAEVAVGVLHNVGNVLNSVNVAVGAISETVRASHVPALGEVVALIRSQNGGLANFLTNDPRGRLIPDLLGQLSDELTVEHASLASECGSLASHVGHIRETVALQQSHATVSGVSEKLAPQSLLDDALKLEGSAMIRHGIEVVNEVNDVPPVIVDRHKTLQILVNLLRNAKQAMADNNGRGKQLVLAITRKEDGPVLISVRDNGMGIAPENLNRIFAHGFTTKGNGRGFGLHISALSAREMGGNLAASSEGHGRGATFTLELPIAPVDAGATNGALFVDPTPSRPAGGRCPLSHSVKP